MVKVQNKQSNSIEEFPGEAYQIGLAVQHCCSARFMFQWTENKNQPQANWGLYI